MDIAGRTAIVTGAAVRLGRSIAVALAEQGCHVLVHYGSSAAPAREVVDELRGLGVRAMAVQADFTRPVAAAQTVFETATAEFDRIDFLVNSAAIFEPALLAEVTEDQWDRHFAINVKAPLFLCQQFAARRDPAGRGHIVNIGDWRATRPQPGHLPYTLSKSALLGMTRILARELGPGVQVNAVAPGAILPPPLADESYLASLAENNPLHRTGCPADVAEAVVYLLRSDFVTGETIHVTGGEQL